MPLIPSDSAVISALDPVVCVQGGTLYSIMLFTSSLGLILVLNRPVRLRRGLRRGGRLRSLHLVRVGRMRGKVLAPATSGDPEFEKAFRIHYNTIEQLIMFLPMLWLSEKVLPSRNISLNTTRPAVAPKTWKLNALLSSW